jgi:hypothetical protein
MRGRNWWPKRHSARKSSAFEISRLARRPARKSQWANCSLARFLRTQHGRFQRHQKLAGLGITARRPNIEKLPHVLKADVIANGGKSDPQLVSRPPKSRGSPCAAISRERGGQGGNGSFLAYEWRISRHIQTGPLPTIQCRWPGSLQTDLQTNHTTRHAIEHHGIVWSLEECRTRTHT